MAVLSTGNVVVTSPFDDAGGSDAGAVYLFNGATGTLISSLIGSRANDNIGSGGVIALSNGNYIISCPQWDNGAAAADAGAVTFGNGTTGISGVVSATNSLVGGTTGDHLGSGGITALSNGNYIVSSPDWDNGLLANAGAVVFGNGQTGASGLVADSNSAIGLTANTNLQPIVVNNLTDSFYARFLSEGGGKIRVGSQLNGFAAGQPVASSETEITLDASNNLVITDAKGGASNDALTIKADTTNSVFVISDAALTISTTIAGATGSGTNSVSIPFAAVTGAQVIVNSLGGDDSLTVDFSLGSFRKAVSFDGGTGNDAAHFVAASGQGSLNGLTVTAEVVDQSSPLLVVGAAAFTTMNALLLNQSANDFSTVTATSNGRITLVDANDLSLGNITGNGVSVLADDALTLTGAISAGAGTVSLLANQDDVGADAFTMAAGASIATTNNTADAVLIITNTLRGTGTGNANLRTISAGTTSGISGGRVTVDANNGAVVDANAASGNITAGNAVLRGLAGVGTSGDVIETTVSRLEGAGGSGGFFVLNSGSLSIGGISTTIGLTTTTGNVDVRANGSLMIEEPVTTNGVTGNILLSANETAATDNLTLAAGQSITSASGTVTLRAGDDVTLTGTSFVSAASSLDIAVDVGDADVAGASLTIAARLSATAITLTGGDDNDSYLIAYPTGAANVGTINVSDAGGIDSLAVSGTNGIDDLTVKSTATNATVSRGNSGGEPINVPSSIDALTLNGLDGNDTFHVQPSLILPMTIDGGAPALGGIGVPPGDTLDLDAFGNTFTTAGNVLTVNGGAYRPLTLQSIETLPISGMSSTSLKFDLNDAYPGGVTTATQTGFISVPWNTIYSATATGAPGSPGTFGWNANVNGFAYGPPAIGPLNSLFADGHNFATNSEAEAKTFSAKVSNGFLLVTVDYGSWNFPNTNFRIENADTREILASDLSTPESKANHISFVTQVTDGTLNLRFIDTTDSNHQIGVQAIVIQPAILLTMTFAVPGALTANGATVDTFQIMNGPINSLVTVNASLGTVMGTDADSRVVGFQVATNASGQAALQIKRPSGGGVSIVDLTTPTGEATGRVSIEYGAVTTRNFDFNTLTSATYSPFDPVTNPRGYIGVIETDLFTPGRGYGWLTSPEGYYLASSNGQPLPTLLLDNNRGVTPDTFRVALPNGTYSIHTYLGGAGSNRSLSVVANGAPVVTNVAVASGTFYETSFNATVSNGLLDLTFSHNESELYNGHWSVSGMEIQPLASVGTITPTANLELEGNGLTVTPITATTNAPNGTEVTVSTTLGTITTTDVDPNLVGTQVLVSNGQVSFNLQAATRAGTASIDLHTINGSHRISTPNFVTFTVPTSRRLDFNSGLTSTTTSTTAAGFLNAFESRTVAADGFGWLTLPSSAFNNSGSPNRTTTALYQDGHRGLMSDPARTYRVEVKPNVPYNIRVYIDRIGLDGNAYDNLVLTAEGVASQTIASTNSVYSSIQFAGAISTDGFMDITIDDIGGSANGWGLNGLDITEAAAIFPNAAPLLAATVREQAAAEPTSEQLSSLQRTAEDIRSALLQKSEFAALSVADRDKLQATQIVIANLNGVGALGLATQDRITLDDDGAGLGWSTSATSVTPDRYDLWSVLAHELLHVVGHEHSDSGLMAPTLSPGLRAIDIDAAFS